MLPQTVKVTLMLNRVNLLKLCFSVGCRSALLNGTVCSVDDEISHPARIKVFEDKDRTISLEH